MRNLKWPSYFIWILAINLPAQTLSLCVQNSNTVECSHLNENNLVSQINAFVELHSLSFIDVLSLYNVTFEEQTLSPGWLDNVALKFNTLRLFGSTLKTIGPRAFNSRVFSDLKVLIFEGNQIESIANRALEGLTISDFHFYNLAFRELNIESNAFESVKKTLKVLKIHRALSLEALLRLTGPDTDLSALTELDISYGDYGDLSAETFQGLTKLKNLQINRSNITSIEDGIFDNSVFENIALRSNQLATLPKNVFRYVLYGLSLDDNPWRCDCDLVWFKDMFRLYPSLFQEKQYYCHTDSGIILSFAQVNFCPDN